MIQVPADVYEAMHQDTVRKKTRVKWTFNDGHEVDVTDRVINHGTVTRSVGGALQGFNVSAMRLELDNEDRYFSQRAPTSVSLLANKFSEDIVNSTLTLEQAVWGKTSGWHYIPVYTGAVTSRDWERGKFLLTADDRMSVFFRKPLPEEVELDPQKTHGEQIRDLITDYSLFTASDIDTTGTFAFAEGVQADLQWTAFGVIPFLTNMGQVVNDMARSGFGVVYADEEGTIKYHTEFPINSGARTKLEDLVPTVIDETNSWGFSYGVVSNRLSTEILVNYSGGIAPYRPEIGTGRELKIGRQTVSVDMPYVLLGRCARQAALVLDSIQSEELDTVTFSTHGIGLTVQVLDRIKVRDPVNDVEATYRVLGKTWSEEVCSFVAVRENHYEDYLSRVFAEFDVTSSTSTTEYYW